jgi:hypothetical protein
MEAKQEPDNLKKRVLEYSFPALIERLERKLGLPREELEELFTDLKLWLYLCGTRGVDDPSPSIVRETSIIDELWHEFILFTKEYTDFCNLFFGRYLHHRPRTEAERREQRRLFDEDLAKAREQRRQELTLLIGYVYDRLGSEVAIRWYETLGQKYAPETIQRLRANANG